jgi:hypothetical protein
VTVTAQCQPRYAGDRQANRWVTEAVAVGLGAEVLADQVVARAPRPASSTAAARASSTAARRRHREARSGPAYA